MLLCVPLCSRPEDASVLLLRGGAGRYRGAGCSALVPVV